MFVTGLTYQNIIDREPALADFDTSYATSFTGLIAEAKAVIDNRLRALGYDLDKIGRKTYFWNWDNEAATEGNPNEKTITSFSTNDTLFIIQTKESIDQIGLVDSSGVYIFDETINSILNPAKGFLINSFIGADSITLNVDSALTSNSICAYLTDPAIYFVHLFKSLEIIYESMRSNPGDLFEQKSLYYGDLYEREFQNLVTFYDADGDGVASLGEQISLNRTTLSR